MGNLSILIGPRLRAITMEGLRIKARAARWVIRDEWANPHNELSPHHEEAGLDDSHLLASFIKDLLLEAPVARVIHSTG